MAMGGEGIGRREREAVRVTVETSPLRGLPIPVCKIQCIAVAKREESGSSWLYLGTDNGHLLLYCLSSSPSPSSSSTGVSGGGGGVVSGFSPVRRSSTSSLQDLELGSYSPSIQSGSSGVEPGKGVRNADPGSDSDAGSLNSSNGIAASPSPQRRSQTLGSGSPIPSPSVGSYAAAASSRSGTNMVLTKRRIMGKTAIEALCALPEVGRIALFFDGQILLLDMRTLGSLERLPATKGASALARAMFSSNAVASLGSMAVSPSKLLLESEEEEVVVDRAIVPAKPPSKIGGLGALVGRGSSSAAGDSSKTTTTTGLVGKLGEAFSRRATLLEGSTMPKDANRVPSTQGESLGKLAIAVRKKLLVYEVHAVETAQPERNGEKERRVSLGWDDSVAVSAFKVREMVCMEGIVTMTWLKNVIIAGTLQEYILFSLSSGQATVLFSLPQDLPWPPLLKLFPKDLEVLLVIDNVGILVNAEGQPTAGSLLFSVVPDAIGQTPPYVVVVKQGRVELHHRKTGGKVQSLDFTTTGNGRFLVADDDAGSFVVIANATKVWCLQQVPLDEQLRDLLKQRQISEAVRLAEESVADGGGDVAKERLAVVHAEAGFLLLFDLQFEEAMDHFLQSDVFQPSELFPFFPSFTSRWRNLVGSFFILSICLFSSWGHI
jgi:hypothetical protein